MRTIIAISLLILLLAAVACGAEAPELVATTEPTTTPASLIPTNTPFSPTAELPAYTITEVDDVSFGSTRRLNYKVKTVAALSDAQIKEVAESIIDARHRQDDLVNALSFMFYFPGNQGPVPNIVLNWAPGGDWRKANTVKSGEYKTFAFDVIDNRLIVETLSELYPATPESTATATLEPAATVETTPELIPTPTIDQTLLSFLLCDQLLAKLEMRWGQAPSVINSDDPLVSGNIMPGDYIRLLMPKPDSDGNIRVQVFPHDNRSVGKTDNQVWIDWDGLTLFRLESTMFECED